MSKDAYWFSHDSNAKDDTKIMLLIDQLGLEGYGIYWILVETLREQPGYRYPLRLLPILAKRFITSAEKMIAVVQNYALFVVENDEFFFSDSLNRRMLHLEQKREQNRLAANKRWEKVKTKDASALQLHSKGSSDAMLNKGKLNKEEKINKEYDAFESFRQNYPGSKRGGQTEFDCFKKKHKDWQTVLPFLQPAIKKQIAIWERKTTLGQFAPSWKNLSTWINNRCWEEEEHADEYENAKSNAPAFIARNPIATNS
jgi:hypothetical protein